MYNNVMVQHGVVSRKIKISFMFLISCLCISVVILNPPVLIWPISWSTFGKNDSCDDPITGEVQNDEYNCSHELNGYTCYSDYLLSDKKIYEQKQKKQNIKWHQAIRQIEYVNSTKQILRGEECVLNAEPLRLYNNEYYVFHEKFKHDRCKLYVKDIIGRQDHKFAADGLYFDDLRNLLERYINYKEFSQVEREHFIETGYFYMNYGDVVMVEDQDFPVLAKARYIGLDSCTAHSHGIFRTVSLIPVETWRHFNPLNEVRDWYISNPIEFKDLISKAVWRGTCTGSPTCYLHAYEPLKVIKENNYQGRSDLYGYHINETLLIESGILNPCSRINLISRWALTPSSHVDVGLAVGGQELEQYTPNVGILPENQLFELRDILRQMYKNRMGYHDILKHRYLVSVEGNDVATNLKWLLLSKSVVMMPRNRVEMVFLESQLIPYKHYVPLKEDTSDLEQKVLWCESRPDKCESIALAATEYASNYLDLNKIFDTGAVVLDNYFKLLKDVENNVYGGGAEY